VVVAGCHKLQRLQIDYVFDSSCFCPWLFTGDVCVNVGQRLYRSLAKPAFCDGDARRSDGAEVPFTGFVGETAAFSVHLSQFKRFRNFVQCKNTTEE